MPCGVPQTNQNISSVSAIPVISISINVQLSIQISIHNSTQLSNIKSNKTLPKLLANIPHTSVSSLQFIVISYDQMLPHFPTFHIVFTCVSYAEARNRLGWTSVRLSVRPSVRPSVTRWHPIKMDEYIVMLS